MWRWSGDGNAVLERCGFHWGVGEGVVVVSSARRSGKKGSRHRDGFGREIAKFFPRPSLAVLARESPRISRLIILSAMWRRCIDGGVRSYPYVSSHNFCLEEARAGIIANVVKGISASRRRSCIPTSCHHL